MRSISNKVCQADAQALWIGTVPDAQVSAIWDGAGCTSKCKILDCTTIYLLDVANEPLCS